MTTIRLNLSKHCVETEIKRQYNRALSKYFKSGGRRQDLEGRIKILQLALETLDFNTLRSTYPPLAGHSRETVLLAGTGKADLSLSIDDTAVALQSH